jgi:branched-chain amino acid transport system substrate-binding protein
MLVSACASSQLDQSHHGGHAATASAPHGAPVVLGLTNQEGSAFGSFPQLREGAEAAVKYVNAELGGVHGRPLQLDTCVTDGSPEGSRKCTDEILAGHPLAVIGGPDIGIAASMSIYTRASIPYLGGMPITQQQLGSPNSVQFTGFSAGGLPAMARFATDHLHAKNVSIIYPDIPGESDFMNHFVGNVLRARGATHVALVAEDPRQPDRTTVLAGAAQTRPDAIIAIEAGGGCNSLFQARQTLGIKAALLITENCFHDDVLQAAGVATDGVYTESQFDGITPSTSSDVKILDAALHSYAPKNIVLDEITLAGFNAVMNIERTLQAMPQGQLTPPALLRTMKAARATPNFLAPAYSCTGKVTLAPSVCNFASRILVVKDGHLQDTGAGWVDGSPFVH